MIAGAVVAGGWIIYNMIQNDPEARRALRDAKGELCARTPPCTVDGSLLAD